MSVFFFRPIRLSPSFAGRCLRLFGKHDRWRCKKKQHPLSSNLLSVSVRARDRAPIAPLLPLSGTKRDTRAREKEERSSARSARSALL